MSASSSPSAPTRKRKGHPTSPVPSMPSMANDSGPFSAMPDVVLEIVASFASPRDVYNLAMTSKHFHEGASGGGRVLATQVLRASLLSSLGRVLASSGAGINLESALKLSQLPPGSVVLAGSTMAQACLGKVWKGTDVDVFATAKAAPAVRSWLVDDASSMFCGFKDYRISLEDDRLAYTVDTQIHHVEQFGKLPEIPKESRWSNEPVDDPEQWLQDRIEYGRNAQRNYVEWKWKTTLPEAGITDIGKAYHIKPLRGHDLPFDFDARADVDLIVAKKECSDASELLADFDLHICRASFDGETFHIPDPHLTFAGKSDMEPNRKALVESYVRHFSKPDNWYEAYHQAEAARAAIRAVRAEHPDLPFYRLVDVADKIKIRGTEDIDVMDIMLSGDDDRRRKISYALQFHNFVRKLVLRLAKYRGRGVEVVDAPSPGREGLPEASFMS